MLGCCQIQSTFPYVSSHLYGNTAECLLQLQCFYFSMHRICLFIYYECYELCVFKLDPESDTEGDDDDDDDDDDISYSFGIPTVQNP